MTTAGPSGYQITVSMPYYACPATLGRAVESVLGQTHRDLTLVVVNDGDRRSPWPLLADIDDDRLVRFDLAENRGRYFADAIEHRREPGRRRRDRSSAAWARSCRRSSVLTCELIAAAMVARSFVGSSASRHLAWTAP